MRAANPDDARAVREALEAAGTKPTIRAVADALNASGQFRPVSTSTVHRWQQRAWRGVEKAGRPKSIANAPDVAAAALTGDPTSTRRDIVARADAEDVERLREMRVEELIALAGRESLVTLVLAQLLWTSGRSAVGYSSHPRVSTNSENSYYTFQLGEVRPWTCCSFA